MVKLLWNLARSIRPRQALKNLAIFAALVFSGNLFADNYFWAVTTAFIIFTCLTSSVYLMNDILDVKNDRLHPVKKFRPIAHGDVPIPIAVATAIGGILLSLFAASFFSFFLFLICLAYLTIQIIYSLVLKEVVILDVLVIATGFILRVYAGALIINAHLSVWFLLCVISLSLFLAVGKRRAELAILETSPNTRKTLDLYTKELLDDYLSIFASSAWLAWALFTFFESPQIISTSPILAAFPLTLSGVGKWLMATIPVVIYAIMRYLKIIYEGNKAESPERVLLQDKPLLVTALVWGLMVIFILYS